MLYSLPYLSSDYRLEVKPRITPVLLPVTQVALTGSLYIVVMVAWERYESIYRPFTQRHMVACVKILYTVIGIEYTSPASRIVRF